MKKVLGTVAAGALALSLVLTGCGAAPQQPAESTQEGEFVGGWTINSSVAPVLDSQDAAVFLPVYQKLSAAGNDFEPVALLATQVVAGTNYAFLCTRAPSSSAPVDAWYVVTVYQDLDGNSEVLATKQLELGNIATSEASAGEVVGGWSVPDAQANAALLPEEAGVAFAKAAENYDGVALSPVATLATQIVAGTNYLVLCKGAPVTANPTNTLYVAEVYADLEGNASFANVEQLDLISYVTADDTAA